MPPRIHPIYVDYAGVRYSTRFDDAFFYPPSQVRVEKEPIPPYGTCWCQTCKRRIVPISRKKINGDILIKPECVCNFYNGVNCRECPSYYLNCGGKCEYYKPQGDEKGENHF